jgi:hypothetical protein
MRMIEDCENVAVEYRDEMRYTQAPPDAIARGRTLLHIAAGTEFSHREDCMRVLELVFERAPVHATAEGFLTEHFNYTGRPVQAAIFFGKCTALKYLLEQRPDTWSTRGMGSGNILHDAVNALNYNMGSYEYLKKIRYIVRHRPDLPRQRDNVGETPLINIASDLCSSHIRSWDAFHLVLNKDTVRMPIVSADARHNLKLPLHEFMSYTSGNSPDERFMPTLRKLLRLYPEAAGMKNGENETPYDIAKRENAPTEVRRLLLLASGDQDPAVLHQMNLEARMAGLLVELKLRNQRDGTYRSEVIQKNDLFRYVLEFL